MRPDVGWPLDTRLNRFVEPLVPAAGVPRVPCLLVAWSGSNNVQGLKQYWVRFWRGACHEVWGHLEIEWVEVEWVGDTLLLLSWMQGNLLHL